MTKRRALVCGSSKGIGAETAIELSKLGVSVTLLARNEESILEVLSKLDCTNTQKHSYVIADFDNHVIKTHQCTSRDIECKEEYDEEYLKEESPIWRED